MSTQRIKVFFGLHSRIGVHGLVGGSTYKPFFRTCVVLENVIWPLGACRGQAGLGEGYLYLPEPEHTFSMCSI